MRLGPALATLALATILAGCRRAPPPEPTPAPAPGAADAGPAAPAATPAVAPPAAREPPPARPPASDLGVAPVPPPAPAAAAPAAAAPAKAGPGGPDEEDDALYSWEDSTGVLHFGTASQAPRNARHLRQASGAVSVVPQEEIGDVPGPREPDVRAEQPPAAAAKDPDQAPGDEPALDADGLPVPGTMKQTAHTRAVKAATGGVTLDPASVEREHQKQLREMNCRVVDGVTICG